MIKLTNSKMNRFSYKDWILYFSDNDKQRLEINLSEETTLSVAEKRLIFPSIRAFQRGEGSDGRYLLKSVNEFVKKSGKIEYLKAMEWFVKEENWHSAYLKKYMDYHHVRVLKNSFLDYVFRKLRQLGGLRCEVTILVTAEMIALTYYDALSKCADSAALKSICDQMLHDELPHIMFQSYTLSHFRTRGIDKFLRILIMEITLIFVWAAFHNVYHAGGYDFGRFIKENLGYLRQSLYLAEIDR